MEEQEATSDHDSWYGKMSQGHSQATKERTSGAFLRKSAESQMQKFLFLDLRKESGGDKEQSWEMGIQSLGELSMLNIGESPNEERESTLSQILEVNPHQKYYLSKIACEGILKRASRRGKELPEVLRMALISQIEQMSIVSTSVIDEV